MTANGIKVLETLARLARDMPLTGWWFSDEIARAAGLNPKGMGAILGTLYYREECLRRELNHPRRQFTYQINEKGLEIARAAT